MAASLNFRDDHKRSAAVRFELTSAGVTPPLRIGLDTYLARYGLSGHDRELISVAGT